MPFAVILATASGIALWPTSTVMSAVQQALADPQSIFADRSPGERGDGALTQTKEAYPMLNDASDMPTPPADMLMEASPMPTPGEEIPKAFSAIVPPEELAPGVLGNFPPLGSGPGSPGIILPLASAPGEAVGGPAPPGLTVPVPPPPLIIEPRAPVPPTIGPNVPSVPEPASWATMIIGFLSIGAIMRRARRGRAITDSTTPEKLADPA